MTSSKQKLENFDIENLDLFETIQYNDFIKSLSKSEALQIIINNTEGDFSQLSDQLREIAEEQEEEEFKTPIGAFNFINKNNSKIQ